MHEHGIMPWGIRTPSIKRRLVQVPRESYQQYIEGPIWLGIYHKEAHELGKDPLHHDNPTEERL